MTWSFNYPRAFGCGKLQGVCVMRKKELRTDQMDDGGD